MTAKARGDAVGNVGRMALHAEPSVRRIIFSHPILIIATAVSLFLAYMAVLSQAFTFDWSLHRPPVIDMPFGLDPNTPGCASGFGREWSVHGRKGSLVLETGRPVYALKDDVMGFPGSAPTTEPVIQLDHGRPVFSSRPAGFVTPQHHDFGVNEKLGIRCSSYFEYSSNHGDTVFVDNLLCETFTFWQKRSIAVAFWLLLMPLAICGCKIVRLHPGHRGRGFETSVLRPTDRAD